MTFPRPLRLAYVPSSPDFSSATDRRRVVRYARQRGHHIEAPRDGVEYDAVVVPYFSDVSVWLRRPRGRTKIIFELSDSYLHVPRTDLASLVRGPVRYLLRQHRYLEWNTAHGLIQRMAERADAVVCSTPEQRQKLLPFNRKVHAILDIHTGDVQVVKREYRRGPTLNLFWEGFGVNVHTLGVLAEPLRQLAAEIPLALHVMSDLKFRIRNSPLPSRRTDDLLRRLLPGVRTYVYQHNNLMLSVLATSMDLAVIPMGRESPLHWAKAENKLLLMWRMGIPTLTSPTPAYARTMAAAGLDMTCESARDWVEALRRYANDEGLREQAARIGRDYAEREHGEERILERWDALFRDVLEG
ncbi:MAG TPA: hypothetical protein VIL35_11320 [Vicinamibacterales bacterium]